MLVAYRHVPRRWGAQWRRFGDSRQVQRLVALRRGAWRAASARLGPVLSAIAWLVGAFRQGAEWTGAWCRRAAGAAEDRVSRAANRIRPRPLGDGAVVGVLCTVTLTMLAVSVILAFAFSAWLRTAPGDVVLAAAAAVTVGVLFLVVMFLVFASKDRTVRRERAAHVGTTIATDSPSAARSRAERRAAEEGSIPDAA